MADPKRLLKLKKDHLSWFDISKYDLTKSWECSEWAGNLILRYMLKGMLEQGEAFNGSSKSESSVSHILISVLCNPVSKNKRNVGGILDRGLPRLWDRTVLDVFEGRERLDKPVFQDIIEVANEWYRQIDVSGNVPEIPDLLNKSFIDLIYKRFPESHNYEEIVVDLDVSDEHLISDFKNWLAKKREVRKSGVPKKIISNSDMQDWHQYRVLAFIDIGLFCQFTDTTISHASLGNILFPDDYDIDVSERIRKVVRPLADRLMKSEFISSLDVQAARAEQKT